MAERRMFSKKVIESGKFMQLNVGARELYFQLGIRADDDGFVDGCSFLMRILRAKKQDLKLLVERGFLYEFPDEIVVIRHWKLHNKIQKDRYHPTVHEKVASRLKLTDGVYSLDPDWAQPDTGSDPEDRLGKDRLGKDRLEKDREAEPEGAGAPMCVFGPYENVFLSLEDFQALQVEFPDLDTRIRDLSEYMASSGRKYKNHGATIRSWARRTDGQKGEPAGNIFMTMIGEETV